MPTITVVNRHTSHRTGDVLRAYVGRPSPLGNPFYIGKHGTREEVIAKYQKWLNKKQLSPGPVQKLLADMVEMLKQGNDLELECSCAPLPCHADIIKEVLEWRLSTRS